MALNDPQTITVNAVAVPMARVFEKTAPGTFVSADGTYKLEVLPVTRKTKVRTVRLRNTKIASDPLVTTTNRRVQDLISLSIIRPLDGFSDAEILDQVTAFFKWFSDGTNANLKKVIAGEN